VSGSEAILEGIRQRREERDRIMLQNLIPILSQLRQTVDTWVDGEFRDLEAEVSHVDGFVVRDSASGARVIDHVWAKHKIEVAKEWQPLIRAEDARLPPRKTGAHVRA